MRLHGVRGRPCTFTQDHKSPLSRPILSADVHRCPPTLLSNCCQPGSPRRRTSELPVDGHQISPRADSIPPGRWLRSRPSPPSRRRPRRGVETLGPRWEECQGCPTSSRTGARGMRRYSRRFLQLFEPAHPQSLLTSGSGTSPGRSTARMGQTADLLSPAIRMRLRLWLSLHWQRVGALKRVRIQVDGAAQVHHAWVQSSGPREHDGKQI